MGGLLGKDGIFSILSNVDGAASLTIMLLVILLMLIIIKITGLPVIKLVQNLLRWILNKVGSSIGKREKAYHRDLEIGRIDEKRTSVKLYGFLSDLIIDLNLTQHKITPYELLFISCLITTVTVTFSCKLIFDNVFLSILMTPIAIVAVFCGMYTKANLAHDARIEAVIEAENIICNNIKIGVVPAVKESLDSMPKQVKPAFMDFIDNIEYKSYHIKSALQKLNADLGSIADDFIKKCIVFELEEEHGIVGMFSDIVEVNNIRLQMRIEMKRDFEVVANNVKIGAGMIFAFLMCVLMLYDNVRDFYLKNPIGQFIIIIDIMILIGEFVYLTYLRAQEI